MYVVRFGREVLVSCRKINERVIAILYCHKLYIILHVHNQKIMPLGVREEDTEMQ